MYSVIHHDETVCKPFSVQESKFPPLSYAQWCIDVVLQPTHSKNFNQLMKSHYNLLRFCIVQTFLKMSSS